MLVVFMLAFFMKVNLIQHDRQPAQFSPAEMEYAEDLFIHKTKEESDLSVQPLWEDPLKEEKTQPDTLRQRAENELLEEYHQKLRAALRQQGHELEQSDLEKNIANQGEAFRQEALELERKQQLKFLREQARKQGYRVIVDENDKDIVHLEKI